MNLVTETGFQGTTRIGPWLDSPDRTDREFWANVGRSRYIPQGAPWTEDPRQEELMENSTTQQQRPENIDQTIEALFEAGRDKVFEDGMESEFSKALIFLVKAHGNAAMEVLAYLITYEKVNAEVASEALRWLGRLDHPPSYRYRRWLLERSLLGSSTLVRDGAALGLASLDDPHAIPYLKQAIQQEKLEELRKDLELVRVQLENAASCLSS